jgi:hypothetical protein
MSADIKAGEFASSVWLLDAARAPPIAWRLLIAAHDEKPAGIAPGGFSNFQP